MCLPRSSNSTEENDMKYKLACDCGWETEGAEDELVAATKEHGRDLHNMDLTAEQALAMAVPIEA